MVPAPDLQQAAAVRALAAQAGQAGTPWSPPPGTPSTGTTPGSWPTRSATSSRPRRAPAPAPPPGRNNRSVANGNAAPTEPGPVPAGPSPVVVRLTEDAWPVLRAARLAALAEAPAWFGPTLAEAQAYDEERWREILRTGATFVALLDENPVGMVGTAPRPRAGECGLGAMWVSPDWRGRGVAGRLAAEVVAWARAEGMRRIRLWVHTDNPRARRFYERRGFVPTGLTKPFPEASGRLIAEMTLDLKDN
jgi:GNAT superfamily N-acetyltransferase